MARIAGTCFLKIDGEQLIIKGGIECPLSEFSREAVMAVDRVAGFKETATKPYVKLTAIFGKDFPLEKVRTTTEMTITAELANGKVYTLSKAWLENEGAVKSEEGEVDLEFAGMEGRWQ